MQEPFRSPQRALVSSCLRLLDLQASHMPSQMGVTWPQPSHFPLFARQWGQASSPFLSTSSSPHLLQFILRSTSSSGMGLPTILVNSLLGYSILVIMAIQSIERLQRPTFNPH